MDRKHNTEIFSPKHPCELVTVGNDCLEKLFDESTNISFRKFTSLFGVTSLWMAILADTGATVLVTANALRLLRFRSRSLVTPNP